MAEVCGADRGGRLSGDLGGYGGRATGFGSERQALVRAARTCMVREVTKAGSLTVTRRPPWRDQAREITVYQLLMGDGSARHAEVLYWLVRSARSRRPGASSPLCQRARRRLSPPLRAPLHRTITLERAPALLTSRLRTAAKATGEGSFFRAVARSPWSEAPPAPRCRGASLRIDPLAPAQQARYIRRVTQRSDVGPSRSPRRPRPTVSLVFQLSVSSRGCRSVAAAGPAPNPKARRNMVVRVHTGPTPMSPIGTWFLGNRLDVGNRMLSADVCWRRAPARGDAGSPRAGVPPTTLVILTP